MSRYLFSSYIFVHIKPKKYSSRSLPVIGGSMKVLAEDTFAYELFTVMLLLNEMWALRNIRITMNDGIITIYSLLRNA